MKNKEKEGALVFGKGKKKTMDRITGFMGLYCARIVFVVLAISFSAMAER